MIEIRYLQAESGANKFGTCNCCGKSSGEDPLMISVKFNYCGHGMTICLCDDCKKKLMEALPPANCSEFPNSSDTISRAKAIVALGTITVYKGSIPFDTAMERIKRMPSAELGTNLAEVGTDCISRQAALDIFDDYNVAVENGQIEAYSRDRKRLCALPSAQPEIIRCKDCKHWDGADTCDVIDAPVWDNDFCSMAERRTDE